MLRQTGPKTLLPILLCFATLLCLPVGARAQRGAIVLPQEISSIVDEAGTIVRGHVISARVEPHPNLTNLYTVVVTLRVEQTLKGSAGATFTFRQFIWDIRDRRDAAGYRKGEHLLLCLTKPSRYGLSSPVDLAGGRFHLLTDVGGQTVAVNGLNNADLFHGTQAALEKKGITLSPRLAQVVSQPAPQPVPLADLEQLIRAVAGTN